MDEPEPPASDRAGDATADAPRPQAKTASSAKAQRLAAALRENLRRRKAATRTEAPDRPRN